MAKVTKITFPYFLSDAHQSSNHKNTVVFFGCDFFNLPLDSDRSAFIEKTNQMLEYIRKHFPDRAFLYQMHPNETTESKLLNMEGFAIGERTIAEFFLYKSAGSIEYVFSACSGASISAYAMGFESAIFLDCLHKALSEESITGYRSYFDGLPGSFFIKSFADAPQRRVQIATQNDSDSFSAIQQSLAGAKKIFVLANDPALALRGAVLLRKYRQIMPEAKTALLMIPHRRWDLVETEKDLFSVFDEKIMLPSPRVWYSARVGRIFGAIRSARKISKLQIAKGDVVISLAYMNYEENCVLSLFPSAKKIFFLENRWYHFVYEENGGDLPQENFKTPYGVTVFNLLLAPLLGLFKINFKEYNDGKVINFFRYTKPLTEVYDQTFVLMPEINQSK